MERDAFLTMLTIPNACHISWCLRSLLVEICKTWPHASTAEDPTLCLNGRNSTLCLHSSILIDSFQNPQILRTISSRHDIIHTLASFPVWGFIMTMVIVISFAHKRKTAPNDYAPELLTRIVQSPTKLIDKI